MPAGGCSAIRGQLSRDAGSAGLDCMRPAPPISLPIILWIVPQLAALALSAGQVPLSAGFVRPAERAALHVMLAAQVTTAALLFPILLRSIGSAACVIALGWAYVLLAAFLATAPTASMLMGGLHVSLWLAALAPWASVALGPAGRAAACAAATLLTLGAAVLCYIRMEYQPGASVEWLRYTPLLAALAQAADDTPRWAALLPSIVIGLLGLGIAMAAARRRSAPVDLAK